MPAPAGSPMKPHAPLLESAAGSLPTRRRVEPGPRSIICVASRKPDPSDGTQSGAAVQAGAAVAARAVLIRRARDGSITDRGNAVPRFGRRAQSVVGANGAQ